jgi:hypothetical protein
VRLLAALLALTSVAAAKPREKARPEAQGYLDELEKRGLSDKGVVSPERLAAEVAAADADLVAGNTEIAAARLYALVEGPRWQDFSESDDFQDAEYRLGMALSRGGAVDGARRYFLRALARGAKAPYYLPSLRAYVDVCIDGRTLGACVAESDRVGATDVNDELRYLRGRAAFERQTQDNAEEELGKISPKSRWYTSALYLRGVDRVRRRDFKAATDTFCAVADVKDGDTLRFFIDGRYYALKDLARLALGRVAHEEKRDDDAFYHYFLIPEDSNRLPEALFEAAWASLQHKDYDLGWRLIDAFVKEFPRSPRAAEAEVLKATLQVKTCRFKDATKTLDGFLVTHEPMIAAIDRALSDAAARQELAARILERELRREDEERQRIRERGNRPPGSPPPPPLPPPPPPTTQEERIAELLHLDPRFFRLQSILRGLRTGAVEAQHVQASWSSLEARVGGTKLGAIDRGLGPQQLLAASQALAREVTRARAALHKNKKAPEAAALRATIEQLEERRKSLVSSVEKAIEVTNSSDQTAAGLGPMLRADRERAAELGMAAARLEKKLTHASGQLMEAALIDLRSQLEDLLRRARLGKIDAVVGEKRKLEKEIEDLAAGRFPPEMFGRLHLEGLIGDDEEYWPPEQEVWLDEYENYK